MIMKMPPRICPAAHIIVDVTSGLTGNVTSTTYSSATGIRPKEAAPRIASMRYGATMLRVGGAKRNARYAAAAMGVSILMMGT